MQHYFMITRRSQLAAITVLAAAFSLTACKKSEAPVDASSPAAVAARSPDPHAGIVAEPTTSPDTIPGTGPAEGGTAIGGVVAGQDAGKPRDSGASEPTGGDGATQATTPPAR